MVKKRNHTAKSNNRSNFDFQLTFFAKNLEKSMKTLAFYAKIC